MADVGLASDRKDHGGSHLDLSRAPSATRTRFAAAHPCRAGPSIPGPLIGTGHEWVSDHCTRPSESPGPDAIFWFINAALLSWWPDYGPHQLEKTFQVGFSDDRDGKARGEGEGSATSRPGGEYRPGPVWDRSGGPPQSADRIDWRALSSMFPTLDVPRGTIGKDA
jgi:hypothetical protein